MCGYYTGRGRCHCNRRTGRWLIGAIAVGAFNGAASGFASGAVSGAVLGGLSSGASYLKSMSSIKPVSNLSERAGAVKRASGVDNQLGKTASPYELTKTHKPTLNKKEMMKLVDNIKTNGIEESVKYVEYNEGKYIVDGHHRIIAAKTLGMKAVPVEEVNLPFAGYKTIKDLLWVN